MRQKHVSSSVDSAGRAQPHELAQCTQRDLGECRRKSHARMSRLKPRARVQRWGPCEGSHLSVCIFRLRGLRSFLHPQPKLRPPPPPHPAAAGAKLRPSSRQHRGTPESWGARREGEAGREEAGGGKLELGCEGGGCGDEHRRAERPCHHVLSLDPHLLGPQNQPSKVDQISSGRVFIGPSENYYTPGSY